MTFLPIAARELRVASRRRFTFRVRLVTAMAAAVMAFAVMAFTNAQSPTAGNFLFSSLTFGAFVFALYAGVFLAADTLSEEKREGTLGLLFLTDLSGFDIVVGKLLITGLNALLALMAVLPVVAVAWILGGVTGAEFWRTALALLNTLFVSLAVSLVVSAWHRRQMSALAWSGGALTALAFGLGLLFRFAVHNGAGSPIRTALGVSPWVGFRAATDAAYRLDPERFWSALALAHGLGWLGLLGATVLIRRRWHDPEAGTPPRRPLILRFGTAGKPWEILRPARALQTGLLEQNPILALLETRPSLRPLAWLLVGAAALLMVANFALGGPPMLPFTYVPLMAGSIAPNTYGAVALTVLLVLLKVLFAWQACEFLAGSRRSGGLELLLCTPLRDEQILNGQWAALRRTFFWPLVMLVVVLAFGPVLHVFLPTGGASPADALAAWGTWMYVLITLPLELLAIAWLGAWLALSGARPGQAFAKTVLFVVAIPALLFCLPSFLVAGLWFGYARNKLNLPFRAILQGVRDPYPLTRYGGLSPGRTVLPRGPI